MSSHASTPDCCDTNNKTTQATGIRVFFFLSLMGLLSACAVAPSAPPITHFEGGLQVHQTVRDKMSPMLRRLVETEKLHGVSVALVDGENLVWAEGFGYADAQSNKPVGTDTVYRAGSIAKLFTAMAVMQLSESQRVDIDQPLENYLRDFSVRSRYPHAPPITPRHLLTHHGGLPSDRFQGMWSDTPFVWIAASLSEDFLTAPPDFIFSYSNLGYALLGHLVQEVSGEPFDAYMRRRLFEPMGMAHSAFALTPELEANLATGHREGQRGRMLPIRDVPALGLYTTAEDLARFMQTVLGGGDGILLPDTLAEMVRAQNLHIPLDFDTRVGLGWSLDGGTLAHAGPVLRHGGATPLFTSELILLPEYGLGVAVLSNTGEVRGLVRQIGENILTLALHAKAGIFPPDRPTTLSPWPPSQGLTAEAAGEYITDFGLVAIDPERNELCACSMGQSFNLVSYADGRFGVGESQRGSGVSALRRIRLSHEVVQGREVLVAHQKGRRHLFGEKITAEVKAPALWRQREGRYRALNADGDFPLEDVTIGRENGVLYLEYRMPAASPGPIRLPLAPLSETAAITLGLGRSRGETIWVSEEGHLHYSGYQLAPAY